MQEPQKGYMQKMQDLSYQVMAKTIWDPLVSGFRPGRIRSIELLGIKSTDRVLFVGEGSGLDFDCLPDQANKSNVFAFDYSSEMVKQMLNKAKMNGVPVENCFQGDAQNLPYTTEKFDKIYFPLSIASIPDPVLALKEAERVLSPGGRVVIFDKLMETEQPSYTRSAINYVTKPLFADITRNIRRIARETSLVIIHYESLAGKLEGCFAGMVGGQYKIAVLEKRA